MYKKSIIFVLSIIITVGILLTALEQYFRPIETDTSVKTVECFHGLPPDSLDVLFLGSSHVWYGVDAEYFSDEFGMSAYNYGCSWQHANTTKLFFQDALTTQNPKIIFLETDCLRDLLKDTDLNGEIYYTKSVGSAKDRMEYVKGCFGKKPARYVTYFFPAIMFHEKWKELTPVSFMENVSSRDFAKSRGYHFSDDIGEVTIDYPRAYGDRPLSGDALAILDYMAAVCRERNIELVLFTIPYEEELYVVPGIDRYALNNNLPHINFFTLMNEISLDTDNDFKDSNHLNNNGARKIAHYLGRYAKGETGRDKGFKQGGMKSGKELGKGHK